MEASRCLSSTCLPAAPGEIIGLFDTHAHLYDKAFDRDGRGHPSHIRDAGLRGHPFRRPFDPVKKRWLSRSRPSLYAAVGIHPQVTKDATEEALAAIVAFTRTHDKVKAVGEIGLDYYYLYTDKETQKYWFARQIELAKELDLPILIHDRDAHGDTLSILKAHQGGNLRGILHCFSEGVWRQRRNS